MPLSAVERGEYSEKLAKARYKLFENPSDNNAISDAYSASLALKMNAGSPYDQQEAKTNAAVRKEIEKRALKEVKEMIRAGMIKYKQATKGLERPGITGEQLLQYQGYVGVIERAEAALEKAENLDAIRGVAGILSSQFSSIKKELERKHGK